MEPRLTFTLERRGSALVYDCKPRGARPGFRPTMAVANWRCNMGSQRTCLSTEVVGENMREAGPEAREAKAVCAKCGELAGTLRIDGIVRGSLPVSVW